MFAKSIIYIIIIPAKSLLKLLYIVPLTDGMTFHRAGLVESLKRWRTKTTDAYKVKGYVS